MAYLARRDIIFDGATFHVAWQCHNFDWFLESDDAKELYYNLLLKYKDRYGVSFYSYCFMSNHPHLTGHIETVNGLSRLFQTVNSQFAKNINKLLRRRGQVVMDRFKSPVIQDDRALLSVMTYGDLNPNRAKMVKHPKEYKWSSYRYYAHGEDDPLITPAPSYLALGRNPKERQLKYRIMVNSIIKEYGLNKRNFSQTQYIGDPKWVENNYDSIKKLQRTKRLAYLARQKKSYMVGHHLFRSGLTLLKLKN